MCGLDLVESRQDPVVSSYDYGNKISVTVKDR